MRATKLPLIAALAATALTAACNDEPTRSEPVLGTTPGWFNGQTVEFLYSEDFFCKEPPESGAPTGCELGEPAQTAPQEGEIPVLYVMAPLGFRPADATLHCPEVGACVTHPSTMDVSRVFGPGTESFELPAHSHIVEDRAEGKFVPWEVEVIGVQDPAVWQEIVAAKNLTRVRELQQAGQGITGDIPTNLFLFFAVR